jgi:hypothetical protein
MRNLRYIQATFNEVKVVTITGILDQAVYKLVEEKWRKLLR